ncbi:MAG: LLM class F420-dependent oxidoreductase [Acidimicrobiia bacterium]|nr:LLM class F420-dependent oxidoreductase [Acidimicrobiia bacterium]
MVSDKVRIALQIQPQHADYDDIRRTVAKAEEMGVDIAYNWDHFFPLFGGDPDPNAGKHFECWTMLAAWAEATESIEIGPLVTCNSYRNPEMLADMARTVDHISGGRLIFGIGSGWFEKDYVEYGYEFGTAPSRLRDLDAAMPRIMDRWSKLDPPSTRKIPVLIGGGGPKVTLRITAEHADVWHYFGTPEEMAGKSAILDDHCARIGRDPAEIERSVGIQQHRITKDLEQNADAYYDVGIRQFTIGLSGPDYPLDGVAEWLAWRDAKNAG